MTTSFPTAFGSFSICFLQFNSRAQERPTDVHAISNAGTGEGIPLQSLPDEAATDRDRPRPLPDGTPN